MRVKWILTSFLLALSGFPSKASPALSAASYHRK
jgi:hypothetical protein